MPKPIKRPWTDPQLRILHRGAGRRTPVEILARQLLRSIGALRQKARTEGLSIGQWPRGVSTNKRRHWRAKRLGIANELRPL